MRSYICLILICITQTLFAQSNKLFDGSKSLKVGDAFEISNPIVFMRGPFKEVAWEQLKEKVVILDFFSTSCITCIEDMPKLQALQNKYADILQIFNVTAQDKQTLQKFFEKNAYLKDHMVNLPVIYSDSSLHKLFPHWAEPHVVFLYKGIVKAITFNRLITEENILSLYQNGSIDLPLKDDYKKGTLTSVTALSNLKTRILLSGYQNGVREVGLKMENDSISNLYKSSFYNRSILSTLRSLWNTIERRNYVPRMERVVWKVRDSTEYYSFTEAKDSWNVRHAICYERLDAVQRNHSEQAKIVLNDIHSLLGINSYFTKKKLQCLILQKCPTIPNVRKEIMGEMQFEGTEVLASFIDLSGKYPLVCDDVRRRENLVIGNFRNLDELNDQLRSYGIEAVYGEREFEVLVIEEFGV